MTAAHLCLGTELDPKFMIMTRIHLPPGQASGVLVKKLHLKMVPYLYFNLQVQYSVFKDIFVDTGWGRGEEGQKVENRRERKCSFAASYV